ncbi:MAG: tRNA (N(6)-L-threonylcarbamoyladenosine(37)-C(2))-methylthiotransferase MtaB [Desulfonatronovibrio sp.]
MKFHIITLGCKINQYESQALAESLSARGNTYVSSPEQARTIIINSCAVTSRAVRDLKKICRKTGRSSPRSRIIITGCAAQVLEKELSALKEVYRVVPQQEKKSLLTGLNPLAETAQDSPDFFISDYFRSRAVVKVQDGCTHRCTYCIVPLTRGKSVSRPPEIILQEISRLLIRGFNEITLGGINLRLYGKDLTPGVDFWDLINFLQANIPLDKNPGLRIRLSSLEPSELNSKALETIASSSMLCPHLHISLQSGSTAVLEKMNRGHYNPQDLINFSRRLKHIWPVFGMGADILTGFPGETQENFQKTLELVQNLPLSYAHIFPYSPRPDTPAASFPGQISDQEKKSRTGKINALIQRKKQTFLNRLSSLEKLNLVMETETKGMSEYYVECALKQPVSIRPKQMIQVKPLYVRDNKLIAEPVQTVKKHAGLI